LHSEKHRKLTKNSQ